MFYDCSRMNIVIAIHSPGAMGSAISARLVEHGARVLTSLDGRSAATVERAGAAGMEDASKFPMITESLLRRGYPESDVRKILGENTLRVMAEAERIAQALQAGKL